MIIDFNRRGFIGASDTKFVMGNWKTDTFAKWWRQKQGLDSSHISSIYTETGNAFEHKITDFLGIFETDQQIIIGRLRVNLDALTSDSVVEIKTHKTKPNWSPPKDYIQQVQVQMYATGLRKAQIVAYALEEEDYEDWERPIDGNRITIFEYEYDEDFIESYLPKLNYLSYCLDEGRFPKKENYESVFEGAEPFG